jgi:hypothetical protein
MHGTFEEKELIMINLEFVHMTVDVGMLYNLEAKIQKNSSTSLTKIESLMKIYIFLQGNELNKYVMDFVNMNC